MTTKVAQIIGVASSLSAIALLLISAYTHHPRLLFIGPILVAPAFFAGRALHKQDRAHRKQMRFLHAKR